MTPEELKQLEELFLTDPDKAFPIFEKHGVDFGNMPEMDIAHKIIQQKYGFTADQMEAVEYIFWISYFAESEMRDIIYKIEKTKINGDMALFEEMLDQTYFGNKITLIEKHYAGASSKNFISLLRKINQLRNDVAHGRIDNLSYGGHSLSNKKGQLKLLLDFKNSALNK